MWPASSGSFKLGVASGASCIASNLSIGRELFMPKVATMDELFIEEIRDLYDAEKQLTKALPKMSKAACSLELKDAFDEHLGQTENQVARLERIFALVGE